MLRGGVASAGEGPAQPPALSGEGNKKTNIEKFLLF